MIYVIDCGDGEADNIVSILTKLRCSSQIIKLHEIKDSNFSNVSGIIISGSPTLLTQVDISEYLELFEFVKNIQIPVLGICLGHQIIGLLYGAKISHGESIDKLESIQIVESRMLFENIKNFSLFHEGHSEFITLPYDFKILASSASCKIEAMQHKKKQIYGVQFHPELSGENGEILLGNFLKRCNVSK